MAEDRNFDDKSLERRIRERAYYIWIQEGRPEGRDKEHWRLAEVQLTAKEQSGETPIPGPFENLS